MKTMQNFVEALTGQDLVDALVEHMLEQVEGFQEEHSRYLAAVDALRADRGTAAVDAVVAATHKRISSDLFFSGVLGLKMNLDHFADPMSPNCTWQQVDLGDYLRENTAHRLPAYQVTEAALSDFYNSLTAQQKEIYSAITEYESHLLTVGPKLAHYYGYLLGDTLLYRIVPGYHPDMALTVKYNAMLKDYLGKAVLPIAV